MSIDLLIDESSRRQRSFNRAGVEDALRGIVIPSVRHLVVVFGGWGQSQGGERLRPSAGPPTDTTSLVQRIEQLRPLSGGRVIVRAYQGAMSEDGTADREMIGIMRSEFHPLGKLVVYGYSAGGMMAMRLAYRLGMSFPYYSTHMGAFLGPLSRGRHVAGRTRVVWGYTRIDLMVTIDAATGPSSGMISRRVWPSVRNNLNIYQTEGGTGGESSGSRFGVGSHGAPNSAFDGAVTRVDNRDWTERYRDDPGRGHASIDGDSADAALEAIQEELDR
ncbi:hypothetical protein WME94_19385 [Sorangium sp. So ce429]